MLPRLSVVIATHDNLPVLERALAAWQTYAADQPVEIIVVEDGCRDGTPERLAALAATEWGQRTLRWVHEDDVHELRCTNRGIREARGDLVLSWHDDMFLQSHWMVPELIATFDAYPEVGVLALSRGLTCAPVPEPVRTWEDSVDWRRIQSTIGVGPLNWLRLQEVDGVMRPWVVRRACLEAVGPLDEAYRLTEWDEMDLCFRVRAAGWKVATHGYERAGAYVHMLSTTYARTPSDTRKALSLENALRFFGSWSDTIAREHPRSRRTWRRRLGPRALVGTGVGALRRLGRVLRAGGRGR